MVYPKPARAGNLRNLECGFWALDLEIGAAADGPLLHRILNHNLNQNHYPLLIPFAPLR